MQILIDHREKGSKKMTGTRKQRAKHHYRKMGHDPHITKLEYGDYVFNDNVVFEFKTIDDFMSSVFNGTVFEEVANQTREYDYSYLIISGGLEKYVLASYYHRGKEYNTLESWRIKSRVTYDGAIRRLRTYCNVIIVPDEEAAFNEMLLQAKKCVNPKPYGGGKRVLQTGNILVDMLTGASGVSFKTSERLIKSLGLDSVDSLMMCTVEDFKSVDKIGDKTATNIYNWLHNKVKI